MAILVGQLIKILERYDQDREVMIHTLGGETVGVNGYFVQKDLAINGIDALDIHRDNPTLLYYHEPRIVGG